MTPLSTRNTSPVSWKLLPHLGRVLVAADHVDVLEGTWLQTHTVVLEFPSMEHARRWYESPGYRSIVQHRFKAATSNLVLVRGYEVPNR